MRVPPLVTVGLPVRDAEATLPIALASIVEQSYSHWELLVVDDDSTDRSRAILEAVAACDPRVRIAEPVGEPGLPARLNQLIRMARGELFARMDADDVAYPDRLARQVAFLRRNPNVDLVGAATVVFAGDGEVRGLRAAPTTHEAICARPTAGFKLYHPTWLGRTAWFRRYGYRSTARRCEDQDLLLRAHGTSTFANIDDPLLGYREGRLDLRQMWAGRVGFVRSVVDVNGRQHGRLEAAAAVMTQALKGSLESITVTFGLQRLLRHRAGPISAEERARFEQVWQEVTEAVVGSASGMSVRA